MSAYINGKEVAIVMEPEAKGYKVYLISVNSTDGEGIGSWGAWRPHQSDWQSWDGIGGTQISESTTDTALNVTQDIDIIIYSGTEGLHDEGIR